MENGEWRREKGEGRRENVVVEARDAHAKLPGNVVNSKRLVELFTEPFDSPGDALGVATLDRNVTEKVCRIVQRSWRIITPCSRASRPEVCRIVQ